MNTILAKQNSSPIYCSITVTVNMKKKTLNPVSSAGLNVILATGTQFECKSLR